MKKLITLLFLTLSIGIKAQTTYSTHYNSKGDTVTVRKTILITIDSVVKKFVPKKGIINGKIITSVTLNSQLYFNNQNNILISGKTIDLRNGSAIALLLQNCSKVHITKCIIENTSNDGIQLYNCSNVLIDSCLITNVKAGVNAIHCTTIQVLSNQYLNMNGPYPSGNFVQFDNVNGSGNWINYNHCEDVAGQAQHPQDGLSIYQCNGLPGDSIQVIGNWIRGGQVQHDSGGAAGIVLGDVGGSYQVARGNILINPGAVGMQVQGGTHIKMDGNIIYSTQTPYTSVGMAFGNYSGKPTSDITYSNNKVRYIQTGGKEYSYWSDPKAGYAPNLINNTWAANINQSILPTVIITYK